MTGRIACVLVLGKKRKSRKLPISSSLEDILQSVSNLRILDPNESTDFHLEHDNAPVRDWEKLVKSFEKTNKKVLVLNVKSGALAASPVSKRKLKTESSKPRKKPADVLTRIKFGGRTKPRSFPKELTHKELHSLINEIFPSVAGRKYHVEYLEGYWLDDDQDWKEMQQVVKEEELIKGRIELRVVLDDQFSGQRSPDQLNYNPPGNFHQKQLNNFNKPWSKQSADNNWETCWSFKRGNCRKKNCKWKHEISSANHDMSPAVQPQVSQKFHNPYAPYPQQLSVPTQSPYADIISEAMAAWEPDKTLPFSQWVDDPPLKSSKSNKKKKGSNKKNGSKKKKGSKKKRKNDDNWKKNSKKKRKYDDDDDRCWNFRNGNCRSTHCKWRHVFE